MRDKIFRCYAYGSNDQWEAFCIDLDISVQGRSFREVLDVMGEAISTYIDDLAAEEPAVVRRLLSRRAPWYVRAKLAFSSAIHILRMDRDDDKMTANFDVPCHA